MTTLHDNDTLPSNVKEPSDLAALPDECLSGNPKRPLRHVDPFGEVYTYVLVPTTIVFLVFVVEAMERFSFYGIYYTFTMYLTGVYNEDWNAGFDAVQAASFVSLSTAVAYTTPFCGALLADYFTGDYGSIVIGGLMFYLPGLIVMYYTTLPSEDRDFPRGLLQLAILFLWPMGAGMVKSVVNVFGAKQFHPILQRNQIESYYVRFYVSINVGALMGILVVPVTAQTNISSAYLIPVILLSVALMVFCAGTNQYVRMKPRGRQVKTHNSIPLSTIFRISLLIVPFCMAYSQMPTTLEVQGTVMSKAFGFLDAPTMNFLDAVSVLVFGSLTGSYLYPKLNELNIKIPTTYKFAIGSFFGTLSMLWALVVEFLIRFAYRADGSKISVLWQAPSYILIGCGEIFAVSAAYEVAFTASSPNTKALASAINIFCVGGIPNLLCVGLYKICRGWFRNARGDNNITRLGDYVTARVDKYFWVLVTILVFGIILNTLTFVKEFVESVEKRAADLLKTPVIRKRLPPGETTPLMGKRHPILQHAASMRAGPHAWNDPGTPKRITVNSVHRLYGNRAAIAGSKKIGVKQQESS